jgi:hypothetical protein
MSYDTEITNPFDIIFERLVIGLNFKTGCWRRF